MSKGVLSDLLQNPNEALLQTMSAPEHGTICVKIHRKSKHDPHTKQNRRVPCSEYEKDGHPFEPLACMQSEEEEDIVFKHHENDTEVTCKQMSQTENEGDDVFKVFARQHTELPSSNTIAPPELAQSKQRGPASDSIVITEVECTRKAIQLNAIMGHNTKVVLKHIPIFEESERCSSFSPEVDASDPVKILRSTVDDADNISFNAYATNVVLAAMDSKIKGENHNSVYCC